MPIYHKKDSIGHYFIYGNHGKKYYYKDSSTLSKNLAYEKSLRQMRAAHVHRYF